MEIQAAKEGLIYRRAVHMANTACRAVDLTRSTEGYNQSLIVTVTQL